MAAANSLDVDTFLDSLPFNRFHLRVLIVSTVMMMVDGYDLAVVGWVLPKLAETLGVTRTALTPALMAQQVGMVIGAYLIAPLADRVGRRPILLMSIAVISVCCAGTLFSQDVWSFAAWRLVTGAFASTIISNLVALSSDIAPRRLRGTMCTIVLTGSMGGALLGALMQAFVLEQYGWKGAFLIGTALSATMLLLAWLALPESLRFLARRNSCDPAVAHLVARMQGARSPPVTVTFQQSATGQPDRRAFIGAILGPQKRLETLLLWLAFICSFVFISIYSAWSTTFYHDVAQLDWRSIAITTGLYTGFGALGTLSIGVAIDRFGFRTTLPLTFGVAGFAAIAIGLSATHTQLFTAVAVMAAFQVGGHSGLSTLAAHTYDAGSRARGVGWAYGAGRVVSIFGAPIGAYLLHDQLPQSVIFAVVGVPLLTAALLSFALLSRNHSDREKRLPSGNNEKRPSPTARSHDAVATAPPKV